MKKEKRTTRFLVAVNKKGKFFTLESDYATTTPGETRNLIDAFAVHLDDDDDGIIHDAPYYFENSDRMRMWLEGFRMVRVTETIEAWVEETI